MFRSYIFLNTNTHIYYDLKELVSERNTMGNVKQVIVVRKDLNMRKGKTASQVAHAAMMFLLDNNEAKRTDELHVKLNDTEIQWLTGSFTKVVCGIDSEDALRDLIMHAKIKGIECHPVIDVGRTEFNGEPTLTCAAFGPAEDKELDEVTGNLKLI